MNIFIARVENLEQDLLFFEMSLASQSVCLKTACSMTSSFKQTAFLCSSDTKESSGTKLVLSVAVTNVAILHYKADFELLDYNV